MRWLYNTTHKDIGLFNVVKFMTYLGWGKFRMVAQWLYWTFLADVLLLTWLGGNEITPITSVVTQLCIGYLFLYLLVFQPLVCYRQTQYSRSAVPRYLLASPKWGQKSFGFSTLTPRNNASWFFNVLSGILKLYVSWLKQLFKLAYYMITSEVLAKIALVGYMTGMLFHNSLLVFLSIGLLYYLLSVTLTLLMIVPILGQVAPSFIQDATGVAYSVALAELKAKGLTILKGAALAAGGVILNNYVAAQSATQAAIEIMESLAAHVPNDDPMKTQVLLEALSTAQNNVLKAQSISIQAPSEFLKESAMYLKTWYDRFSK
jgi:hypothetical protein